MPWKEKSCRWLWSTWLCLKEGTSYSTSMKPRAEAKLPVGADLLWKQAHVLSLCPCLSCAFEQELNAVWASLNKHGMVFLLHKCILKGCAAILSCYTEVSKLQAQSKACEMIRTILKSLIAFCESRMNYLLLCLWPAYSKRKNNLIFWMFSTSLN